MIKHSIQKQILSIKNLSITLPPGSDRKYAVENASLDLNRGEILCVVGESGSGKSVMTSAILKDVPQRLGISSGEILFNGNNILNFNEKKLNEIIGNRISMIYQEPMAALNPAMKIGFCSNPSNRDMGYTEQLAMFFFFGERQLIRYKVCMN